MRSLAMLCLLTLILSGCASSPDGNKYSDIQPRFDFQQFFDGKVNAWGIVQNRSGDVTQRFTVSIDGKLEGGQLKLDETFNYAVGNGPKKRLWVVTDSDAGRFKGSAGDVKGDAMGVEYGNALNWTYKLQVPVGGRNYVVTLDDWMWAFDDNTIINRTYVRKFGLVVAEVTIFMRKQ